MNLYKTKFDLNGSANTTKLIQIPSDTKYSIGVKVFDGNNEVTLDEGIEVTLQDDCNIFQSKEIFNNQAIFASSTNGPCTKKFKVKFHREGVDTRQVKYTETVMPKSQTGNLQLALSSIIDYCGPNFEDFDYGQFKYYAETKVEGKDYTDYDNATGLDDKSSLGKTSFAIHSEDYPTYQTELPPSAMKYSSEEKTIRMWRIDGKYGFISDETVAQKVGQPVDSNDFLTGDIAEYFGGNVPNNKPVIARFTVLAGNTFVMSYLYGKPVHAVDREIGKISMNVVDSRVSPWAITDSEIKIVQTEEWATLSANADPTTVYIVVPSEQPSA